MWLRPALAGRVPRSDQASAYDAESSASFWVTSAFRQALSGGLTRLRCDPIATCAGDVGRRAPYHKLNLKGALRLMRQWRDAGVPLGCRTRDSRRRELLSMPRCRSRETGSGFDALAVDGAVDRRAADAEELGDFEGAVLAAVHQRDQVRL